MKYINFDKRRKFDIILMGRVAIDFNPLDYFKPLSESTDFRKYVGGSPANTAVGLSRLGKKVGFISKVSDDQFGDYVTNFFKKEKIDCSHIFRAKHGEKLGLTFTEILSKHESSILMYRNMAADLMLEPDEIDTKYIKSAKVLLISGCALSQNPSRQACLKALAIAKKTNTKVIFDVDYRPYNWKNKKEISTVYTKVANHSDIILGSREEFDLIRGARDTKTTDKTIANHWFNKGNSIIVIKHGKKGSTAYTKDGKSFTIKPFPVKAFKSFGGGDGYASAFINGVLDGRKMIDCLEMGSASASMLVSAHGCSLFMPTMKELKAFIKKEKKQYGAMVARGK